MTVSIVCAIISGGLLAACVVAWLCGFDFSRLLRPFQTQYETKTYAVASAFSSVEVDAVEADVSLLPAQDGQTRVECSETDRLRYTVTVENNTLRILRNGSDRSFGIGFTFGSPKITVYLADTVCERLSVKTVSGDISAAEALRFASAELRSTSGDLSVSAAVTGDLTAKSTSGDVSAENAGGTIALSSTSGDCRLTGAVGAAVSVQSTSGEVYIADTSAETLSAHAQSGDLTLKSLQVAGAFTASAVSGDVRIESVTAAAVSATTSSGDLTLRSVSARDTVTLKTTSGDLALSGVDGAELSLTSTSGDISGTLLSPKRFDASSTSGDISVPSSTASAGLCRVKTTSGDIRLTLGS